MDYGYGSKRIYTVSTSRNPVYCTYSTQGEDLDSLPISLTVPRSRIIAVDPYANTRRVVIPQSHRRILAGLDLDDEERLYSFLPVTRPFVSYRVSNYLDDLFSSTQMEDIKAENRKIQKDARAALERVSYERTPVLTTRLSGSYFPDVTYMRSSTSNYEPVAYTPTRSSVQRDVTPGLDESYYRSRRAYSCTPSRYVEDPLSKVRSEISRKAIYSKDCREINDSVKGAVRGCRPSESNKVKNHITFRAQYAKLRDAANVGSRND